MSEHMAQRMDEQIEGSLCENERLQAEITRLRAKVARLEAEKAEAVKDAERYRWLRERLGMGDFDPVEGCPPMMIPVGFRDPDPDPEYEQQIDAAIDTAMRGDREDG